MSISIMFTICNQYITENSKQNEYTKNKQISTQRLEIVLKLVLYDVKTNIHYFWDFYFI